METFLLALNKSLDKPLYEQLYIGIKEAIIHKQIATHTKLPSKRQLAEFLNISQTTVELAYEQLLAEGYIMSKPRVGYFVEEINDLTYLEKTDEISPAPMEVVKYTYDFSPGKIDEDAFPFSTWRKLAKDVIDESSKHLLQVGHRQGEYALRQQISQYLYESRGILCIPEQIVIGSGTEHLLPILLNLFDREAKLALENPGYSPISKEQLASHAVPIEVDEDGLIVEQLTQSEANIVYITPSHQFPTGAVLSAARRTQLLKWAAEKGNRYIIEDDYDSEFRYKGKPIPALCGLDQNDKVIYMSTFTKSLMPSLRVAYFVLPKSLLASYEQHFSYYSSTVPRFDQHILASFMREGHFAKHLNRMRKIYRKKHDKLLTLFETHYPNIKVTGDVAGMHILISVPSTYTEAQLTEIAAQHSLRVYPLKHYLLAHVSYEHPTFLIGFGGIPLHLLEDAIHSLMAAFEIAKQY